jgi:hypothetical protein
MSNGMVRTSRGHDMVNPSRITLAIIVLIRCSYIVCRKKFVVHLEGSCYYCSPETVDWKIFLQSGIQHGRGSSLQSRSKVQYYKSRSTCKTSRDQSPTWQRQTRVKSYLCARASALSLRGLLSTISHDPVHQSYGIYIIYIYFGGIQAIWACRLSRPPYPLERSPVKSVLVPSEHLEW